MTPDELRAKVPEALLRAEEKQWPGDAPTPWNELLPHEQANFIEMADAVIPLILDAAKQAVEKLHPAEAFDAYDHGEIYAIDSALSAIDSLRTKP